MRTEDARIIARYLDGDREAVETIDAWIVRAGQSYRRRLQSRWDDVLQDLRTQATALLREGKFHGRSSLKTYLYRVVSHACLNQIRSQERWQWTDLEDVEELSGHGLSKPSEEGLEAKVSRDLLLRILRETPSKCRRLWAMILEGLDYREMSARLGVSTGTLRVRVLRCRKQAVEIRERLLSGAVPRSP